MLEKLSLYPKLDKILLLIHRLMLPLEYNYFWQLHQLRDRTIPLLRYFSPTLALSRLLPSRICVDNSSEHELPIFSSSFGCAALFSDIVFVPLCELLDTKRGD